MKTKLIILSLFLSLICAVFLIFTYYYESSSYLISSTQEEIEKIQHTISINSWYRKQLVASWDYLISQWTKLYDQAKKIDKINQELEQKKKVLNDRINKLQFSFFWKAYATEEPIVRVDSSLDKKRSWSWVINFDTIVVHHSATDKVNIKSISQHHKQRHQSCMNRRVCTHLNEWYSWSYIDYHFVIFKNGIVKQTRPLTTEWRATKYNNRSSIHILLEWNFTQTNPTTWQYSWLKNTITDLMKQFNISIIEWHGKMKWERTSCPWDRFKRSKIGITENVLSRYYSPTKEQKQYLAFEISTCARNKWRKCTLSELYNESIRRQFNWDNDHTMPKDWKRYTDADWGRSAACPKDKFWLSFIVLSDKYKDEYKVYTCRDVWWAIQWNRIDIYAGIWDHAVKRFNELPTGKQRIIRLD